MRPEGKSSSPKRAKLLLSAELGWLRGYPLGPDQGGLRWLQVPEQGRPLELRVDRERLHRANRALRTLLRDHTEALEGLVGPVEPWSAGVQATLDLLRGPATGEPPPADPGRWDARLRARIGAAPPALAPLLRALGWCLQPDELAALLPALLTAPGPWAALSSTEAGLRQAVLLATWIPGCGAERLGPVLALLLQPTDGIEAWTGFPVATKDLTDRLQKPGLPITTFPKEDWSALLNNLLLELAAVPERGRRRALDALGLLRPPTLATRRWWTEFETLLAEVDAVPAPGTLPIRFDAWRESIQAKIQALLDDRPPQWWPEAVAEAVLALARGGEQAEAVAQGLARLPVLPDVDLAAAFLVSWTREPESARGARHARRWARSMRPDLDPARLSPWGELIQIWGRTDVTWRPTSPWRLAYGPDATLMDEPEHAFARFYDHFDGAATPPSAKQSSLFALIFASIADGALAERIAALLDRSWAQTERIEAIGRLCALLPDDGRVRALMDREPPELNAIARGLEWFRQHGQAEAGLKTSIDTLRELGDWLGLAGREGSLPWPEPGAPDLGGLPEGLHAPTRELSRWSPDASERVRRILDELVPPDATLDREIAALQARVGPDDSPLRRRLSSLLARRGQGALDARQLQRARVRIERSTHAAMEAWLRHTIQARSRAWLRALLGVEEAPEWAGRADLWRSVVALGDVDPSIRALALRLLRRRCGPPSWDLREDPTNASFLDRLRARGLKVEPWLEDRRRLTPADIELSLEPDPLEILRMGAHFGTCLSPGGINFFSAVVNAADINKRVIYARDARGRVVGRSLVGLTEQGLVVFEAYCHRAELDFAGRVRAFVSELAAEMGTAVRSDGVPKALLAARWYDDGAVDIARLRERVVREGPIDQRLLAVAPEELVSTLREAIHPGALRDEVLSHVFAMQSFERRPELARILATELLRIPDLNALERTICAAALARAGAPEEARRALPRLRPERMNGLCCGFHVWSDTLVALDPSFIPRILRMRGEHEFLAEDALALGASLEALGRPVQALAAYHNAVSLSRSWNQHTRQRANEAIQRLTNGA